MSFIVTDKATGRPSLYVLRMSDSSGACEEAPMEFALSDTYGALVSHTWHGDGYLAMCFANGYVCMVSPHNADAAEARAARLPPAPPPGGALSRRPSRRRWPRYARSRAA